MTVENIIKNITDRFGDRVLKVEKKSYKRVYIDIYPKDVVDMVKYVFKDLGLRFNIASAVDDFDRFEILYHFSYDLSGVIVSIRTMLQDNRIGCSCLLASCGVNGFSYNKGSGRG